MTDAPSLAGPLLAFVAIVALIPAAVWLLKRSPVGARWTGTGLAGTAAAPVRLVGSMSLAPSQRIVTVEVGTGADRQWLVLGVSAAGIHTLHQLPAQQAADAGAVAPPTSPASAFSRLLASQRSSGGETHAG